MKVAVVVVDVADIRSMIAVLLQNGKRNLCVDAQCIYRHKAFVASLLLHDAELTIAEVFWRYAHKVAVSLAKVASQNKHISHLFKRLDLVFSKFHHLLLSEVIRFLLTDFEVIDVRDFIRT